MGVQSRERKMLDNLLLTVLPAVCSSPTLVLTDCSEQEFKDVRNKYEGCANQKIENITELLQTAGNTDSRQDVVICDQVKQLINHCGQLLDQCFKLEQIEDTKVKQRAGIQRILSKRFSTEQIAQCFSNSKENISTSTENISTELIKTEKNSLSSQATPEEVFVANTTSATVSTTTTTTTSTEYRSAFSDDQATTPNPR